MIQALSLLKARLGITTSVRDDYLQSIIDGVIVDIQTGHGVTLDETNASHLMFVVDYADYRYSNRDNPTMPRHLQWRLHNLVIASGEYVE